MYDMEIDYNIVWESVSWLASLLNIAGLWFLPKRKYLAIIFYTMSSTCFLLWSVNEHVWSIASLQTLLLVLNIRTYIIWKGQDNECIT